MFILIGDQLSDLSGFAGNSNPTERLSEIRSKISDAENRVRDLESLLTDFILNPNATTDVDGNRNGRQVYIGSSTNESIDADASVVRQALYAARAYEGELRTAEQFWNQIVESNKSAEKDTHELFKKS